MHHTTNSTAIPPQMQAILDFQRKMTKKSGNPISISEAIAAWIATGYAEKFREDYLHHSH